MPNIPERIGAGGLDLIQRWEGCVLHVYKDIVGYQTVGYGHKLSADDIKKQTFAAALSLDQAAALLQTDLVRFEQSIQRCVKVDLNANQFDALVCFSYNVGTGAFETSTLLKLLNGGKYQEVPGQLVLWCHAGAVRNEGLYRRRQSESALWSTPPNAAAPVPDITDDDRARVLGLVAVSLADITRSDDPMAPTPVPETVGDKEPELVS